MRQDITAVPADRRCSEVTKSGDPCRSWARRGESTCFFHSQDNAGRKKAAPEEQPEEQALVFAAEQRLRETAAAVDNVDPLDPLQFDLALSAREIAAEQLRKALASAAQKNADMAEPPARTPQMMASGQYWERRGVDPDHGLPRGAFREGDDWFVWRAVDNRPPTGPRNLHAPDPDIGRMVADAGSDRQPFVDPAISNRLAECMNNGYALQHYAGLEGMDPGDYFDYLVAQQQDNLGHDVDLNGPMREYDDVILPTLRRAARRRAWSGIHTLH